MNTITKLRGRDALGVVRRHGGRLQGLSLLDCSKLVHAFDDMESAAACARELKAGGVEVLGVRPGRGNVVLTHRTAA